jgi:hypothetical protein
MCILVQGKHFGRLKQFSRTALNVSTAVNARMCHCMTKCKLCYAKQAYPPTQASSVDASSWQVYALKATNSVEMSYM